MLLIDKKLILLSIIYLNQYLLVECNLKGYYFNKTANKYIKISSTSTTLKPKFTISTTTSTTTTTTTTTTTESPSIKRNDDIKKIVEVDNTSINNVKLPIEHQNNQTSVTKVPNANYESESEIERPKINMLDFISGMSKAIHLLIYQRDPMKGGLDSQESAISDNQTNTREQHVSIFRPLKVNSKIPPEGIPSDYRAQAELLRQQIIRRCSQLQNIIKTTNEILRERENYMFVKILDNFSTRIEHTKTRADLILKEPSTSITAVKALNRINYGLNNMNHLVQNVLSRVNVSINLDMKENQKESRRESKKLKSNKNRNDKKETISTSSNNEKLSN